MTAVDALIPVKLLEQGKQRLGGLLTRDQRREIVLAMLADLIAALQQSSSVRTVYVTTRDDVVSAVAASARASVLREPVSVAGLNGALEWARRVLLSAPGPPTALLVLPADLPGAEGRDVRAFVEPLPEPDGVRICPSQDLGTNALLLRPPDAIPFAFGAQSSKRHRALAEEAGYKVEHVEPDGLRLDIDHPEDLGNARALVRGPRTAALFNSLQSTRRT